MTNQGIAVSVAATLLVLAGIVFLFSNYKNMPDTLEEEPVVSPASNFMAPSPEPAPSAGGCFIGGCSGQICSDQKDVMSTCEFKEEYACYKNEKCERQADGKCGWTQTPTLSACLMVYYDE